MIWAKITKFFARLNKNELLIGFLYPIMFVWWLKWTCVVICPISSVLWAMSGATGFDKIWRRLGCPAIVCSGLFFQSTPWVILGLPISFGVSTIGYGLPATQPPDAGSALGNFWWEATSGNEFWANTLTRGTIYLLLFLSYFPFIILGNLWR